MPDQHIFGLDAHNSSPGTRYIPEEPVIAWHSTHFDRIGETPVGWHERAAIQREDSLLGDQVVKAYCPPFLCYH